MNNTLYDKIIDSIDITTKNALNKNIINYTLFECIDFDEHTKEVWYVPEEINIETSIETNPTKLSENLISNIEIWSIFKRKKSIKDNEYDNYDGNPLLYAFKHEKQWHFRTNKDKNIILSLLEKLIDKFFISHKVNVTVVMPTGSTLNNLFSSYIKSKNKNAYIIDDMLRKLSCEEVWDILSDDYSEFKKHFGKTRKTWENAKAYMFNAFNKMKKLRNGYFTYHLLPESPEHYRDYITNTLALEDWSNAKYADDIIDKDILIIDDSMSRGHSIKNACEIIDTFKPKSITVLTLFSQKYNE